MKNAAGKAILDPQVVGAWGGIQSGGQIFAMWTGPFISDRFGRKTIMYIFTLIVGIAVAIEITAENWRVYAIARLLNGMAVGFVQSGITVYIAEVSSVVSGRSLLRAHGSVPQIRGSMLSFYSVTYNLGGLCGGLKLCLPPLAHVSLDRSQDRCRLATGAVQKRVLFPDRVHRNLLAYPAFHPGVSL